MKLNLPPSDSQDIRYQGMDRNDRVDYASKEYWNERYTEEDHFEWISNGYQKQLDAITAKGPAIKNILNWAKHFYSLLQKYQYDNDVIYGSVH